MLVELFADALVPLVLFVMSPMAVFWGIAQLKKAKAGTGTEMRASELKALIGDAVGEATAGLSARVADLEERLGDEPAWAIRERVNPPHAPRLGDDVLAAALDPDADMDDARPVRRATRA